MKQLLCRVCKQAISCRCDSSQAISLSLAPSNAAKRHAVHQSVSPLNAWQTLMPCLTKTFAVLHSRTPSATPQSTSQRTALLRPGRCRSRTFSAASFTRAPSRKWPKVMAVKSQSRTWQTVQFLVCPWNKWWWKHYFNVVFLERCLLSNFLSTPCPIQH